MTTNGTPPLHRSAHCARVQPMLDAYADGELARVQASFVAGHLQDCTACQSEFESLNSLRRAVRGSIEAELATDPTADLWSSVRTALAEEASANADPKIVPVPRRLSARPALAFVAVAVVGLVTLFALPADEQSKINVASDTFVIEEIDAGNNNVMVYESPDTNMTVIWVFDGEDAT